LLDWIHRTSPTVQPQLHPNAGQYSAIGVNN
jgi:hypothetical protein